MSDNKAKVTDTNVNAESFDYSDTFQAKLKIFWKRLRKNKFAVLGLIVLTILYLSAAFAPLLTPYSMEGEAADILMTDRPPTYTSYTDLDWEGNDTVYPPNYFGRDELGRDVFARTLYAGRISLTVGFVSVGIYITIGTIWGAIAGYYGGWVDNMMMRIVDAIMAMPIMLLLITIMALFTPNIFNVMIVIGITGWTGIARYVRAEFLSLKKRDFTEAARCIGAKDSRIIFRHILPNAVAPIIVAATMGIAGSILTESTLSFLGLGVQPPTASWGNMLTNAQELSTMVSAPWKAFYPGMMIFITVLSFNFFGDGLRDALDPRLKQ